MKESILRTLVPVIYALLLRTGIADWLGLDDAWTKNAAAAIATLVVYVVLRYAEKAKPWIGWLLGYAKQPVYVQPANVPEVKAVAKTIENRAAGG